MNRREVFVEDITKATHSAVFLVNSLEDSMATANAVECIQGLLEDLRKLADLGQFGDFASEVGATKDTLKALAIAEILES